MEKKTEGSRLQSDLGSIKELITVSAGIGAIGYAAGFMVVSGHLIKWGITDSNLLKARYISVGFLFIIQVSLIVVPGAILTTYVIRYLSNVRDRNFRNRSAENRRREKRGEIVLKAAYPVVIALALTALVSFALSLHLVYVTYYANWPDHWIPFNHHYWDFVGKNWSELRSKWFIPLFIAGLLAPLIAIKIAQQRRAFGLPNRLWLLPVIMFLILFGTRYYSEVLYGDTANEIGGGQSFLMRMTPAEGKASSLAQLMVVKEEISNGKSEYKARWVFLLEQSEKSYFVFVPAIPCENIFEVRLENCRTIEVPKDLVGGLIHYNPKLEVDGKAGCD